jgi:hypothetical protein
MVAVEQPMKQPTKDAAALERTRADLKAAFEETDRLAAEKRQLESQLAGRFVEMIALTRIAQRAEDERDAAVADRNAAMADRDAAVAEGNNALAQASAMKAELDDALLKHASEIERLQTIQAAMAATHAAELAQLRAEADAVRQAAGRRAQSVLTAVAQSAPWRWLPGRMRASALSPLVRQTGLLDPDWYVVRYEDVGSRGLDPVRHYLTHGVDEGRYPNEDAAFANGDDPAAGQGQTGR